jgi:hypothetical protein
VRDVGPPGPVAPPPAGLWQPADGATPAASTYVYLESEPLDFIGQGKKFTYTDATLTFAGSDNLVSVTVAGTETWSGDFVGMSSIAQLQPGYYGNLHRYPFYNPFRGGLDWSGQGRGCNTLTGWFVVDSVTYSGATLTALDLRFEQHCDGSIPALHGKIHVGP